MVAKNATLGPLVGIEPMAFKLYTYSLGLQTQHSILILPSEVEKPH